MRAADSWYGLLAPAGTPKPIIDRIAADVTALFADPALREKLTEQDMAAVEGSGPATLPALIVEERAMWRDLVVKQKIKID